MRSNKSAPEDGTVTRILDVAQAIAQQRGFNGFSYADIAAELGITKASLHYHFATKAALGQQLITRYTQKFMSALARLEAEPRSRLRHYVQLYDLQLVQDRMCLCGMFAAEYLTLPKPMQKELRAFFDKNEAWLAECLERGRADGSLHFAGSALEAARALTAGLEGSMLLARSYEAPERFTAIANRLLSDLGVGETSRAGRRPASRASVPRRRALP